MFNLYLLIKVFNKPISTNFLLTRHANIKCSGPSLKQHPKGRVILLEMLPTTLCPKKIKIRKLHNICKGYLM
jgi:hypothetical protein